MGDAPISVIMPAYDRAQIIGRALASIAAQQHLNPAEVIVVDDGSRDATSEVARQHGAYVVRHEANRGVSAARNSGLAAASHPWVAFLDSDDEWLPHHLSSVWELRGRHVLVADTALRCGSDPLRYKRHGPLTRGLERLTDPAQLVFPGDRIPMSCTLVKREYLVRAGGFRPLRRAEDFDMWLRLLERGTALLSPRIGVIYHLHDERLTADEAAARNAHVEVARLYSTRPWFSQNLIERWRGLVAWDRVRHALRHRQFREAARNLLRLAGRPQWIYGAARYAVPRTRNFRASARVAADGQPALAVFVRDPWSGLVRSRQSATDPWLISASADPLPHTDDFCIDLPQ